MPIAGKLVRWSHVLRACSRQSVPPATSRARLLENNPCCRGVMTLACWTRCFPHRVSRNRAAPESGRPTHQPWHCSWPVAPGLNDQRAARVVVGMCQAHVSHAHAHRICDVRPEAQPFGLVGVASLRLANRITISTANVGRSAEGDRPGGAAPWYDIVGGGEMDALIRLRCWRSASMSVRDAVKRVVRLAPLHLCLRAPMQHELALAAARLSLCASSTCIAESCAARPWQTAAGGPKRGWCRCRLLPADPSRGRARSCLLDLFLPAHGGIQVRGK